MAGTKKQQKEIEVPFLNRNIKTEQMMQSRGTLNVLDLDFDKLFVSVEDFKEADIDAQGNLILEHFVNDQLLAREGIPLTCDDMRNIFNTTSIARNQENLKAG